MYDHFLPKKCNWEIPETAGSELTFGGWVFRNLARFFCSPHIQLWDHDLQFKKDLGEILDPSPCASLPSPQSRTCHLHCRLNFNRTASLLFSKAQQRPGCRVWVCAQPSAGHRAQATPAHPTSSWAWALQGHYNLRMDKHHDPWPSHM